MLDWSQLTECLRGIIWEHGAWHAAALILHRCSLLLPHPNEALGELSALLAKLEACVPTEEPPVCPSHFAPSAILP